MEKTGTDSIVTVLTMGIMPKTKSAAALHTDTAKAMKQTRI